MADRDRLPALRRVRKVVAHGGIEPDPAVLDQHHHGAAVNCLPTEPDWNIVSEVTGTCRRWRSRSLRLLTLPFCTMATATPGMLPSSRRARSRRCDPTAPHARCRPRPEPRGTSGSRRPRGAQAHLFHLRCGDWLGRRTSSPMMRRPARRRPALRVVHANALVAMRPLARERKEVMPRQHGRRAP